jgi:hypothetical protein
VPTHHRRDTLLLFTLALCAATGCTAQKRSAQPTATNTTADAHTHHLKREERAAPLTDWQTRQSRDFKIMRMLLPVGWNLDVRPGPNFATIDCADTSGRIIVSAANPDKTLGVVSSPPTPACPPTTTPSSPRTRTS